MVKRFFIAILFLVEVCGRGQLWGMKQPDTLINWCNLINSKQFDQFEKDFLSDSSPFTKELLDITLLEKQDKFKQVNYILGFIVWKMNTLKQQIPIIDTTPQGTKRTYVVDPNSIVKAMLYQKTIELLNNYAKTIQTNDLLAHEKKLNTYFIKTLAPLIYENNTPNQTIKNLARDLVTAPNFKKIFPNLFPIIEFYNNFFMFIDLQEIAFLKYFIKEFSELEGKKLYDKIIGNKKIFNQALSNLHQNLYNVQKKFEDEVKKAEEAKDTGTVSDTEFKFLLSMRTIYSKKKADNIDKVKKENLPTLEKLKTLFSQKDFEHINEILKALNNYLEINPYIIDLSPEAMAPPKAFSTLKKLEDKIIDVKDIMLDEKIWKNDQAPMHYFRKQLQSLTGFNKINFGNNNEVKIQGFKELKDCFQESQQEINEIIQFFISNRNSIFDINKTLEQSKKRYENKISIENEKQIISLINLYKLSIPRLTFQLSCDNFYTFVFSLENNKAQSLFNGITNESKLFFYFFKKGFLPESLKQYVKDLDDLTTYALKNFKEELAILNEDINFYFKDIKDDKITKLKQEIVQNTSRNLVKNYFSSMDYADSFGFFYGEKEINIGVFKQLVEKLYEFKEIAPPYKLQIIVSIMELIYEKIKSKTSTTPGINTNFEDLCNLDKKPHDEFKDNTYFVYACSLFLKSKDLFPESFKNMVISYLQTKKIENQVSAKFLNEIKPEETKKTEEIKIGKKLADHLATALTLLKVKLLSLAKKLQTQ